MSAFIALPLTLLSMRDLVLSAHNEKTLLVPHDVLHLPKPCPRRVRTAAGCPGSVATALSNDYSTRAMSYPIDVPSTVVQNEALCVLVSQHVHPGGAEHAQGCGCAH